MFYLNVRLISPPGRIEVHIVIWWVQVKNIWMHNSSTKYIQYSS